MKAPRSILLLAWVVSCTVSVAGPSILPFDQVRSGMRGTGLTVFEGTRVESFEVEIVGKLPNIGPEQDLILGRCSGGPLADTRVLSGMSGSPVFVDGQLIGAIAYSWGFSTEAIAGITPIEEMLSIADLDSGELARRGGAARIDRAALDRLAQPASLVAFFADELEPLLRPGGAAFPVTLPLSVAGLGHTGLKRILPDLARVGFVAVQTGGAEPQAPGAPPIEPGSAVGLKLVRGDVEMAATGTVTWVDGDRVLALGHPLFGLGQVDLPMTGATVQTLLPSLNQSARVASPLAEIGALRQDRASGVFGRLGAQPQMIPVRLRLISPSAPERGFAFDVADDPLLSPVLLYFSLNGILSSLERGFGSATVRLRDGSGIRLAGGEDVELDNLYAGPTAYEYGTGVAAYVLHLLMNNAWSRPQIAGVNLILEYDDVPRTGRIRRAAVDRYRVRPGETLHASVIVDPFRGPTQVLTAELRIPEATPPGTLTLQFGSALATSQRDEIEEPALPRDLSQLVRLINQLKRNDRLYITATREDRGVLLEGARMPNLPPSVARVLAQPRSRGNFVVVAERRVIEESLPTDYAVEGSARVRIEVEAP